MDFPVCPSCHQSVIDDDAVDCPFCGASMKAKTTSKPVSKTATATQAKPATAGSATSGPAKSAPKPSAPGAGNGKGKSPPAKSGGPGSAPPGDDFPFDFEVPGKPAIPALPNPTKQRAFKVICPMCDTPGYLPATAAGQDVKCANPKCVMPVFTAPAPKTETVAVAPPRKASKLPMLIGLILVLGIAGGGIYAYMKSESKPKGLDADSIKELQGMTNIKKPADPNAGKNQGQKPKGKEDGNAEPVGLDKEALIADVLKLMDGACKDGDRNTKASSRQLSAEACAVTGNQAAALKHLDQLMVVAKGLSYYRIMPRLDMFWADLAEGDPAKANASLAAAVAEVPNMPKQGRICYEIVGRLATALVAAGKTEDALAQISAVHSTDADAQFAARLQIVTDGVVGIPSDSYSVLPWKSPLSVATTASLINRDQADLALKWAASQTDEDAKAECLAFWAEDLSRRKAAAGSVDVDEKIATAIRDLPPVLKARIWARAGCGRLAVKDMEGVSAAIKLVQEQLAQVKSPPAALTMPEDKSLIRFQLPPAEPLLQAATAVAEVAFLQAQTEATLGDAEKSLNLAMKYADATAPSFASAEQRWDATVGRFDLKGLREWVKKTFKMEKNPEAMVRARTSEYQEALTSIKNASQQRFNVEMQLLSRLRGAGVGLNSAVWIIVNSRSKADNIDNQDDFFTERLAGELVEGLKSKEERSAVIGAWSLISNDPAPPRPLSIEFKERLKKDPAGAVKLVEAKGPRTSERDEFFLRQAAELAATKQLSTAFKFIAEIADPAEKLECYRMATAIASQPKRGQVDDVWKEARNATQQTEKIAICRGLIAGLTTPEK